MLDTDLLSFIKNKCGGVSAVATRLNVTPRAIYKWTAKNALPRTEFTGETNYAKSLSELSGADAQAIKDKYNPIQPEDA